MTVRGYAPGRINLIGEHTDYNDGYALPIALGVGATARFDPSTSDSIAVSSREEGAAAAIPLDTSPGTGAVRGWPGYVAGCVWALREHGVRVPGGAMTIASDVPVGAGLSSSAAIECAVLEALVAASGSEAPDRTTLARIAQRAENEYVGAPTGLLDQMSSLYGEQDTALLLDFRSLAVDRVPMNLGTAVLLAIDSRTPHQHAGGEYGARRRSCEAAAAELGLSSLRDASDGAWTRIDDAVTARRARHVITENARVLAAADALASGDFTRFGELMVESHHSMRDDFEITVPAIDFIADAACRFGAYGARMTGGGFGGTVVVLAPASAAERIVSELPEAVHSAGHPRPSIAAVRPGGGAFAEKT